MTKHAREFNYGYGVSKIVSVELSSTGATVLLSADGGKKNPGVDGYQVIFRSQGRSRQVAGIWLRR